MWFFIPKGTVLQCEACGASSTNEADWYIDVEHLITGRVVLACHCALSIDYTDLYKHGARLVSSPKLGNGVESVSERNLYV